MQKSSRQPNGVVEAQSLVALGLCARLQRGSHTALAPRRRSLARCSRHQPTSTATSGAVGGAVGGAVAAKAAWLPRALARWPDEPEHAPANLRYQPECGACARSHFWLCRSHVAPFFRCLDALTIKNYSAGMSRPTFFETHLLMQRIVQAVPGAVLLPPPKTRINGAPRWKLARQVTPLTTGSQHVKNGIHHFAARHLGGTAKALLDKRLDLLPLAVGQITRIAFIHTISLNKC